MIASVVLAVAVIGVATTIAASHQQTGAVGSDAAAVATARQLMEEIAAKPLVATDATPGWAGGQQNRLNYDTISDYAGFTETSPVNTLEGHKMQVGPDAFVRTVTITYPTTVFGTTTAAGEFALVEVSVTGSQGSGCTLRRLVARTTRER
jgi:Tfp pilus assembly protein PilV